MTMSEQRQAFMAGLSVPDLGVYTITSLIIKGKEAGQNASGQVGLNSGLLPTQKAGHVDELVLLSSP
jgi:hypothetical protein